MTAPAVTDYRAVWNVEENKGNIQIKVQGVGKAINLKISSGAEYLAVLAMLDGPKTVFSKPPYLDTKP